jgi:threonine/homoserine/homoserine lactone efflux protein
MQSIFRMAGGILLFYLAWSTFQKWKRRDHDTVEQSNKIPGTLFEAALVNLLNPNPYLGWALVIGPVVVTAWQEAPSMGIAVVVAFYATMVSMLAVLILLFSSARLLTPRLQSSLTIISIIILAGLGTYQLMIGIQYLKEVLA